MKAWRSILAGFLIFGGMHCSSGNTSSHECGDGTCDPNEDCLNCPEDCAECPSFCGDGTCDDDEDCTGCPEDCGECPANCGDGTCDDDENCLNCPQDCGDCPPACGDGHCDPGEGCEDCAEDCGACPGYCGDCLCDPDEDCYTCELDCGECTPNCGDGSCEPGEDCDACPEDCGSCLPLVGDHPRIFFSRDSLENFRDMAQTTHQVIYDPIYQFVINDLDATGALQVPDPCDQLAPYRLAGNELIAFAFVAVISGEQAVIDKAKERLLTYARVWPHWGEEGTCDGRDLGHHHMLYGNLLAFDWLYDQLTQTERDDVVAMLIQRARESYQASVGCAVSCRDWWRDSYIQNHSTTNHSALGMAALVLQGHVPDQEASDWLLQVMQKLLRVIHLQNGIADGTWHEGVPYQAYGQTMMHPFLRAYREASGVSLMSESYAKNIIVWRLANTRPGTWHHIHTYGNFQWNWGNSYSPTNIYRAIASEYPDSEEAGLAEWLVGFNEQTDGRHGSRYRAPWYVYEFFYYDPQVTPIHPQDALPSDLLFPDLGAVVWRTGWHDEELIFGLKAGRQGGEYAMGRYHRDVYPFEQRGADVNLGHDHQDAGNFFLVLGDNALTHEKEGYGNPEEDTPFHNTILIDGQQQYDLPSDGMNNIEDGYTEITGPRLHPVRMYPNTSYLLADLTNAYRETQGDDRPGAAVTDRLERQVLFVKPDYLVMVDKIQAPAAHQFEWAAHFPGPVTLEGDWLKGTGEDGALLGIKVLGPANFATSYGNDGLDYVRVTTPGTVNNLRFINVLVPVSDWNARPEVTLLADGQEGAGVRVTLNGTRDHLFHYGENPTVSLGEYQLTGRVASVERHSNGALSVLFLEQVQELTDAGLSLVAASGGANLEASFGGAQPAVDGSWKGTLRLYAPQAPDEILVNGELHPVTREGEYLLLGELAPTVPESRIRFLESRIQSGPDDAQEWASGSVDLTVEWLELGDSGDRLTGLHFEDVQLPSDAVILEANLQFTIRWEETGAASLTVSGEAAPDAAGFSSSDHNLSSRSRTTAQVAWTGIPPWTDRGVGGPDACTPDITPIIEEILALPGWTAGNGMNLFVEGDGVRVAQSFESDPWWAARLMIRWGRPDELPESCLP